MVSTSKELQVHKAANEELKCTQAAAGWHCFPFLDTQPTFRFEHPLIRWLGTGVRHNRLQCFSGEVEALEDELESFGRFQAIEADRLCPGPSMQADLSFGSSVALSVGSFVSLDLRCNG